MSIEITEVEMINRFSEAMKEAASASFTLSEENEVDKPQAFIDFIHSLKVAAGSAHQIYIYRENIFLGNIRDTLEAVIDQSTKIPPTFYNRKYWLQIKEAIEGIRTKGIKAADTKAMSRQDVLAHMDIRERNARIDPESMH